MLRVESSGRGTGNKPGLLQVFCVVESFQLEASVYMI